MRQSDRQAVILAVAAEARERDIPALDWTRLEERLKDPTLQASVSARDPSRIWRRPVLLAAAAALLATAAIVLWPSTSGPGSSEPLTRRGFDEMAATDGQLLNAGQVIQSEGAPLAIRHAGVGTWRLAPHSQARVVALSPRITIALQRGRIDAAIEPSRVPEVFAVEVESTKIAVHGTVFSVQRRGDFAEVTVREGSVVVGPTTTQVRAPTEVLTAPAQRLFDLRAESTAPVQPQPATLVQAAAPEASASPATRSSTLRAPTTELSEHPSVHALAMGFRSLSDLANRCFVDRFEGDNTLTVSFSAQLTMDVAPDGHIRDLTFSPPIATAVRECTLEGASRLRLPASRGGALVSRPVLLSR